MIPVAGEPDLPGASDRDEHSEAERAFVLLTNDDGIESPGIRELAGRLADEHDVLVAAPSTDMSGAGTSIGRVDPDLGVDLEPADFDGIQAFAVDGPPGLVVMAASLGAFDRIPDLVVSGINAGINTGHSVIHSGTVGAALTARTFRHRGLAVSLAPSDPWHWATAADVGVSAARWVLARPDAGILLNVNVPARAVGAVEGIRWADLDEVGYFRVAVTDLDQSSVQFEVRGSTAGIHTAGDTAMVEAGYVTATPLRTVEPAPYPDEDASAVWSR